MYTTRQSPNLDNVIDVEYTEVKPDKPEMKRSFLDALIGYVTPEERLQIEVEKMQFQALLTEVALSQIGKVSEMEQKVSRISPYAAERCRVLIDGSTQKMREYLRDVRW